MIAHEGTHGSTPMQGQDLAPFWDALIETSYTIVEDAQCDATGLVPNWWVPVQADLASAGTTG